MFSFLFLVFLLSIKKFTSNQPKKNLFLLLFFLLSYPPKNNTTNETAFRSSRVDRRTQTDRNEVFEKILFNLQAIGVRGRKHDRVFNVDKRNGNVKRRSWKSESRIFILTMPFSIVSHNEHHTFSGCRLHSFFPRDSSTLIYNCYIFSRNYHCFIKKKLVLKVFLSKF